MYIYVSQTDHLPQANAQPESYRGDEHADGDEHAEPNGDGGVEVEKSTPARLPSRGFVVCSSKTGLTPSS